MSKINSIFVGWKNLLLGLETEEQKQKLKICMECTYVTKKKTCSLCGCYVPAKVKSDSKCPQNKW